MFVLTIFLNTGHKDIISLFKSSTFIIVSYIYIIIRWARFRCIAFDMVLDWNMYHLTSKHPNQMLCFMTVLAMTEIGVVAVACGIK